MRRALTPADFPLVAADCLVFGKSIGTAPVFLCPTPQAADDLATVLNAGIAALSADAVPPEPVNAGVDGWVIDGTAKHG